MKAAGTIRPLFFTGSQMEVTSSHERLCLLGLSLVEFLRPRDKLALVEMLGGAAGIYALSLADLSRLTGRRLRTAAWDPVAILDAASRMEKLLTGNTAGSIFYWDAAYPPQLREIYDPPVTLFFRGTLPDNGLPLASVVGTRFPTGAARTASFRLGFELAREGICVVSGLARGIDRDAHEGCVAAGGVSVAVLGNGIDLIYPEGSRDVGMALLERGGAIVSEYPPGVPPLQYHFPARNRIISGLARAVVVVQAPERSGALITAEYALEQGREVYVHAAGIEGSAGAGTRRLAESGAPLVRGAACVLREWGMTPRAAEDRLPARGEPIGSRLAAAMQREIEGACASRAGESYWRT